MRGRIYIAASVLLFLGYVAWWAREREKPQPVDTTSAQSTDSNEPATTTAAASATPPTDAPPTTNAVDGSSVPSAQAALQPSDEVIRQQFAEAKARSKEERAQLRANAPQTKSTAPHFRYGSSRYIVEPELFAVPPSVVLSPQYVQLAQAPRVSIYRGTPAPPQASPVVRNEATGNYGVLTGTLAVRWKDAPYTNDALQTRSRFDHLKLVLFAVDVTNISKALALADQVRKDPRVSSAELEVLEKWNTPK
jgi:hypothetical protein